MGGTRRVPSASSPLPDDNDGDDEDEQAATATTSAHSSSTTMSEPEVRSASACSDAGSTGFDVTARLRSLNEGQLGSGHAIPAPASLHTISAGRQGHWRRSSATTNAADSSNNAHEEGQQHARHRREQRKATAGVASSISGGSSGSASRRNVRVAQFAPEPQVERERGLEAQPAESSPTAAAGLLSGPAAVAGAAKPAGVAASDLSQQHTSGSQSSIGSAGSSRNRQQQQRRSGNLRNRRRGQQMHAGSRNIGGGGAAAAVEVGAGAGVTVEVEGSRPATARQASTSSDGSPTTTSGAVASNEKTQETRAQLSAAGTAAADSGTRSANSEAAATTKTTQHAARQWPYRSMTPPATTIAMQPSGRSTLAKATATAAHAAAKATAAKVQAKSSSTKSLSRQSQQQQPQHRTQQQQQAPLMQTTATLPLSFVRKHFNAQLQTSPFHPKTGIGKHSFETTAAVAGEKNLINQHVIKSGHHHHHHPQQYQSKITTGTRQASQQQAQKRQQSTLSCRSAYQSTDTVRSVLNHQQLTSSLSSSSQTTTPKSTKAMADQAVIDKLEAGFAKLQAATPEQCHSLLKKYLTREVLDKTKTLKTAMGATLLDVAQSGFENLDSGVGIYAPDAESYTLFADLFNPIIEDYHGGFKATDKHPASDFGDLETLVNVDPSNEFVISTRVRCGRSLKGYPFNPCLTEAQYKEMEQKVSFTLKGMEGDLAGTYYPLTGMTKETQQQLIDDHFLFKEGDRFLQAANACRYWPTGRGIYHNDAKTFLVWVNEEDHLRIISMQKGGDLKTIFGRLVRGVRAIEAKVPFSRDDRLGFLTFCPTNLGTTIRASVHIKLPKLAADRKKLEEVAGRYNLQVRGTSGEHTESVGGVYDISNKRRLGLTEYQAVREMQDGILELIKIEKSL